MTTKITISELNIIKGNNCEWGHLLEIDDRKISCENMQEVINQIVEILTIQSDLEKLPNNNKF